MNAIPTGRELADVICQRLHSLERENRVYKVIALTASMALALLSLAGVLT